MKKIALLFITTIPLLSFSQNTTAKVKELVSKMSTEEKIKLVVGMGFKMPSPPTTGKKDTAKAKDYVGISLPPTMQGDGGDIPEKVPGAAGRTHGFEQLSIPSITVADGPAGVRINPTRANSSQTYYATAWPVATLLASTWDTALVKKVGVAFGNEIKEYGVDIILGPGMNIHRNPLGGRNFEYYSEDPVVSGNIAAAIVKGIQSNGVGTSIKHYAANNQETNRNSVNVIASERALREIYLKGFEITVKQAQPWTVMSSYNYINGPFASESYELLTNVLRKEWGFKGFVMTDWFGGKDAVAQMKAGNDLLMPGTLLQQKAIADAVKNGALDEKILNENCERILNIVLQSPSYKKYKYSDKPNLKEHAQISRDAAAEGMILLKNNDALPLKKAITVSLFGNTSYNFIAGGTGSGDVNKAYTVSLLEGLKNVNINVNESLKKEYEDYIVEAKKKQPQKKFFFDVIPPIPEYSLTASTVQQQAASSDIAIITIGRNAGEGSDRKVENDFNLSAAEQELIKTVSNAFHAKNKKVIIVLNIGGVIETYSWRDDADAILLSWQGGIEGGNAVAEILSGKVNPSGKLATSFPISYNDVPSAKNFPGKDLPGVQKSMNPMIGTPSEVIYEEGIYVGYRYYNKFNVKTAYPFGYGLSYTNFKYSNLKLSNNSFSDKITATITVTNTGKVSGKEVVELYISAPTNKLDKPNEELKAFAKTKLLAAGEAQTLTFTITAKDLASFNTQQAAWIADAGTYTLKVAASATDVKQSATFNLAKDIIVEKVSHQLVPTITINELK
ncbi:MAG: glycoside hydrolase family 3 C-terminal domain-containing protein [Sphingobacteriia bacterium]|nr:glycoside hydrolase family 3 C-terminal domain-containing protein [Sphingobacteriia bacterium]